MKDALRQGGDYPPLNLLLVGNEENGEIEAMGTPHALRLLARESSMTSQSDESGVFRQSYAPALLIAGERTGEKGDELWGEVCTQNRGIMRFEIIVHGQKGHSGTASASVDLSERLLEVKTQLSEILSRHLTLNGLDSWQSQVRFPFIQVGTPGIYNVTADRGVLGVEVRPIPQDNLQVLRAEIENFCAARDLELRILVMESGIICNPENPYLKALLRAIETLSGKPPVIGRKLPGTSARFAPEGQGVVWGQSGLGPHSSAERHYIPSIEPYYRALDEFGKRLKLMALE
jgi:acetylornithine deacetylase/succinyl-diaminopimelate desuccinylase-like protein